MEVEVKLRIPNFVAHQIFSQLLTPFHFKTHLQENVFFDGFESELSSKRAVLRLIFYDGDSLCIVYLKAKAVITDGVSRAEANEEEIDPMIACAFVSDLSRLRLLDNSRILDAEISLAWEVYVRAVHDWEGHELELDETQYDFGKSYELECESTNPKTVKKLLRGVFAAKWDSIQIFSVCKFAVFRLECYLNDHLKSMCVL